MAMRAEATDNMLDDVYGRFDPFRNDGREKRFGISSNLLTLETEDGCADWRPVWPQPLRTVPISTAPDESEKLPSTPLRSAW